MSSIFTKIVNDEIPSFKVHEDKNNLAFLDINPNTLGHTLCIPKKEIDKLFDLKEIDYKDLMLFSRGVAMAIRKVTKCKRVGLSVIGLEVPHVHVHLIPLNEISDATFQTKANISKEVMESVCKKIRTTFNQ